MKTPKSRLCEVVPIAAFVCACGTRVAPEPRNSRQEAQSFALTPPSDASPPAAEVSRIEAHVANVIVLREPRALPTAERVVQDLVAEIRLGDPRRVDERFLDDAIDLHARQVASTARALWRARIDGARTDRRGETSPLHAEGTRQLVRSEIENSSDLFLKRVAPNLPPTGERDVLVTFHLRGEAVSDLLKRRADLRIFLWLRDTGGRYQVAGYAEEATP